MQFRLLIVCMLYACGYVSVEAALLISEVAWMGNSESANNEWIELYNDGSESIDVTDWVVTDGMNLQIQLAGTVGAGHYALLERTDDTSAPGSAFHIYTGALANTGATLQLQRSDGSLEDQVAGGENWQAIGGDNVTKETAQLTTSGWVTGTPTPGKKNVAVGAIVTTEESTSDAVSTSRTSATSQATGKSTAPTKLVLPDVDLSLTIDSPTLGYVNQPITFSVTPAGVAPVILNSLVYEWNFGDLGTATLSESVHVFRYPGTYVVTVQAAYARHKQVARTEITILPVAFSLTRNQMGDVQISNDAPYEIDLSGYVLAGSKKIILPPRTTLLPNNTITVPRARIESHIETMVALYDTESVAVATLLPGSLNVSTQSAGGEVYEERAGSEVAEATSEPALRTVPMNAPTSVPVFAFSEPTEPASVDHVPIEERESLASARQRPVAAVVGATIPHTEVVVWPYLGLVALLSVAFVSLYVGRNRNETKPNLVLFDDHDKQA